MNNQGGTLMNSIMIGLAGGTGSGKTTFAHRLQDGFNPQDVRLISHDFYYKKHDDLTHEQRCQLNYDHPNAFDTELMVEQLKLLKAGQAIDCPTYDYTIHNRTTETVHVTSAPIILVEGILLFENDDLCDLFDLKVFIDTDADERILRRILRDVEERGRTLESVIGQYLDTVKPMHDAFVEPSKRKADFIVPNGGENQAAKQLIAGYLAKHLLSGNKD